MKDQSELLNIQWQKYLKWILRFPLILVLFAFSMVVVALILALGISLANKGNIGAVLIILIAILGLCAISLSWIFYISRIIKASHKMLILLEVSNRKLALNLHVTYIFLSFAIFMIHLPYFIFHIISKNVSLFSLIPFVLLIGPGIYFYYKITKYYKGKNICCDWKGIIK